MEHWLAGWLAGWLADNVTLQECATSPVWINHRAVLWFAVSVITACTQTGNATGFW